MYLPAFEIIVFLMRNEGFISLLVNSMVASFSMDLLLNCKFNERIKSQQKKIHFFVEKNQINDLHFYSENFKVP